MNFLLIGAAEHSSTDGVIIKGVKYLLNRVFPDFSYTYLVLRDTIPQNKDEFHTDVKYDLIVICGTPWLWDSFQNTHKYKNLLRCIESHSEAKVLFMGIGSCLYFKDIDSDLLERPAEVDALKILYKGATVIARDHLALDKLTKAGIEAVLLPCPAYFCYGDEDLSSWKEYCKVEDVLVFQDPTVSISKGEWLDQEKLNDYFSYVLDFYKEFIPNVYCANKVDIPKALSIGLPCPIVIDSADETLRIMRTAKNVMSGRVHCAVPAIVAGAKTQLLPLDTRSYVVSDFKDVKDFNSYCKKYDEILKYVFTRKVGTESQRTYELYKKNGFFEKYMSGVGLDIGYAGYTDGVKPILDTAIGVDTDFPDYDGKTLPFPDESQDYVYNSHCLEHIEDYQQAIKEWFRVLKVGGHMVVVVPHQYLYEKKANLPSIWNLDHKRFYTPSSLLGEIEASLVPNSYRVRLLEDGDREFNYNINPLSHSTGQYEILLVLQKLSAPAWELIK